MVCLGDVFDEPNPDFGTQGNFSGAVKQMVEWVEFRAMTGVEHFLLYTFKGSEQAVFEVMPPYMEDPCRLLSVGTDGSSGVYINDCLFRAKNHAKWLMPTIDIDECTRPNLDQLKGLAHDGHGFLFSGF